MRLATRPTPRPHLARVAALRHCGRSPASRGYTPAPVAARWADLGLAGPQVVRDLWRQRDLATADGLFAATVAPTASSSWASPRRPPPLARAGPNRANPQQP